MLVLTLHTNAISRHNCTNIYVRLSPRVSDSPGHNGSFVSGTVNAVTANIGYAFHRREQALFAIGTLKTYVTSIYIAHRDWSWPEGGSHDGRRNIKTRIPNTHGAVGGLDAGDEAEMDCGANSQEHYRQVRGVLLAMTHGMRDYLSVPLVGSKDLYLPSGKRIRKAFGPIQRNMLQFIYTQVRSVSPLVRRRFV